MPSPEGPARTAPSAEPAETPTDHAPWATDRPPAPLSTHRTTTAETGTLRHTAPAGRSDLQALLGRRDPCLDTTHPDRRRAIGHLEHTYVSFVS